MRAPWLFGFSPVMCTVQRVSSGKKIKKFAVAKVKIQFNTPLFYCAPVSVAGSMGSLRR